jgi:hypothetical protein
MSRYIGKRMFDLKMERMKVNGWRRGRGGDLMLSNKLMYLITRCLGNLAAAARSRPANQRMRLSNDDINSVPRSCDTDESSVTSSHVEYSTITRAAGVTREQQRIFLHLRYGVCMAHSSSILV